MVLGEIELHLKQLLDCKKSNSNKVLSRCFCSIQALYGKEKKKKYKSAIKCHNAQYVDEESIKSVEDRDGQNNLKFNQG